MEAASILIVDDEPIAIEIIESYLLRLEGFSVAGKFTNPVRYWQLSFPIERFRTVTRFIGEAFG